MSSDVTEKLKKTFLEYVESRKKLIEDECDNIKNIKDSFTGSNKAIITIWERSLFLFSELFEWISTIMPSLLIFTEQFENIRNSIDNLKTEIKPESKEKVEDLLKDVQDKLVKTTVEIMQREPPDIFG